ncbi:MAG: hypothetical protein ACO3DT_10570 [Gammaproteobacteria bacterium]
MARPIWPARGAVCGGRGERYRDRQAGQTIDKALRLKGTELLEITTAGDLNQCYECPQWVIGYY